MVFVAKLLLKLHLHAPTVESTDTTDELDDVLTPGQELRNLMYQMDRLTRYEAGHHPKESMKRSCVFKWIAAVAMAMGSEHLPDWLYRLIPPLYKELSNSKKVAGTIQYSINAETIEVGCESAFMHLLF